MTYAHAGHWVTSVVYMIPLLAFLIWLVFIAIRDRMHERDD
jgi:hypothetical protein